MLPKIAFALPFVLITVAFTSQPASNAQESSTKAKTLETGTFHGKVHQTTGRATIYQEASGTRIHPNTKTVSA